MAHLWIISSAPDLCTKVALEAKAKQHRKHPHKRCWRWRTVRRGILQLVLAVQRAGGNALLDFVRAALRRLRSVGCKSCWAVPNSEGYPLGPSDKEKRCC